MPITNGNRNIGSGYGSPMIPMVTNNPAFKVAIIPLDGRFEQKPNQKNDTAQQTSIKVGNTVRGEIVSRTRKKNDLVIGRVLQILMEDGAIVAYKIITQRGKEVLIDPSATSIIEVRPEELPGGSEMGSKFESRVLLYEEWKMNYNESR